MQIVVGVAITVLGAAILKLWEDHDSRLKAIAALQTKVDLLQDQIKTLSLYVFGDN